MSKVAVKVAAAKKGWRSRKRMAQVTEVATVPHETSNSAWDRLKANPKKGEWLCLWSPTWATGEGSYPWLKENDDDAKS
jgi:hypothetical protein